MSIRSLTTQINKPYPIFCSSINGVQLTKKQIINLPSARIDTSITRRLMGFLLNGSSTYGTPSSIIFYYNVVSTLSAGAINCNILRADTGAAIYTSSNTTQPTGLNNTVLNLSSQPTLDTVCDFLLFVDGGSQQLEPLILEINY